MTAIFVHPDGTFRPYEDGVGPSTPENIDDLFKSLKETKKNLAIFIHGGLVTGPHGKDAADTFDTNFKSEAQTISIVWRSGFWTALEKLLANTQNYLHTSTIQTKAVALANQFQNRVVRQADLDLDTCEKLVVESLSPSDLTQYQQSLRQNRTRHPNTSTFEGVVWHAVRIVSRVLYRETHHRMHAFGATVEEETLREILSLIGQDHLGEEIWGEMKNEAAAMWVPENGSSGVNQPVGTYLLTGLNKHIEWAKAQQIPFRVDLVVHSAGAIVACELFDSLHSPEFNLIKFRNVVFLAPACRSRKFQTSILPFANSRYESFRLFAMDVHHEKVDHMVQTGLFERIYPSSLLYFVSALCEPSDAQGPSLAFAEDFLGDGCILGLMQHRGDGLPYKEFPILRDIWDFLAIHNHLVLTPTPKTATIGMRGGAIDHGDFTTDPLIVESIQYLMR